MSSAQPPTAPPNLSDRELQVLRLVATGATNNQIARELTISPNTVKVHLNNIFSKLGVQSRTEASLYAVRRGWVEVPRPELPLPDASAVSAMPAVPAVPALPAPALPARRAPLMRARVLIVALAIGIALGLVVYPSLVDQFSSPPARTPPASPAPFNPVRWRSRAPLASPREAMAAATVNGLIYLVGGLSEGAALTETFAYDPAADEWQLKSPKPTAVQGSGAVVIGGRVFVPGGCDGDNRPVAVLEIYDPSKDAWQSGVPLPRAICHYAIGASEGRLFVFGGWDGSQALADVWSYDPARGEWTSMAPLPSPRMDAGAAAINERVYVVGGRNGEQLLADVLAFDPSQSQTAPAAWTTQATMRHARAKPGVVALAGNLYVFGGGWATALAANERYDTRANSWLPVDDSPSPPWRVGGIAPFDTRIYVFGGWSGAPSAQVQEYTALYRSLLPAASN